MQGPWVKSNFRPFKVGVGGVGWPQQQHSDQGQDWGHCWAATARWCHFCHHHFLHWLACCVSFKETAVTDASTLITSFCSGQKLTRHQAEQLTLAGMKLWIEGNHQPFINRCCHQEQASHHQGGDTGKNNEQQRNPLWKSNQRKGMTSVVDGLKVEIICTSKACTLYSSQFAFGVFQLRWLGNQLKMSKLTRDADDMFYITQRSTHLIQIRQICWVEHLAGQASFSQSLIPKNSKNVPKMPACCAHLPGTYPFLVLWPVQVAFTLQTSSQASKLR